MKVTSITRRNSSRLMSMNREKMPAKALLTQTSMRPNLLTLIRRASDGIRVRYIGRNDERSSPKLLDFTRGRLEPFATARQSAIEQPRRANSRAVARPIPGGGTGNDSDFRHPALVAWRRGSSASDGRPPGLHWPIARSNGRGRAPAASSSRSVSCSRCMSRLCAVQVMSFSSSSASFFALLLLGLLGKHVPPRRARRGSVAVAAWPWLRSSSRFTRFRASASEPVRSRGREMLVGLPRTRLITLPGLASGSSIEQESVTCSREGPGRTDCRQRPTPRAPPSGSAQVHRLRGTDWRSGRSLRASACAQASWPWPFNADRATRLHGSCRAAPRAGAPNLSSSWRQSRSP